MQIFREHRDRRSDYRVPVDEEQDRGPCDLALPDLADLLLEGEAEVVKPES